VSTAVQGTQNSLPNQSSMIPITTPEAQMMNPGVPQQVAGGTAPKIKMGSFYVDDDTDDMLGGGTKNTDADKDLIDQYITIQNDNKDIMIDHHLLDDETEEIIITPKKQRK
jgi:hypothetical protein